MTLSPSQRPTGAPADRLIRSDDSRSTIHDPIVPLVLAEGQRWRLLGAGGLEGGGIWLGPLARSDLMSERMDLALQVAPWHALAPIAMGAPVAGSAAIARAGVSHSPQVGAWLEGGRGGGGAVSGAALQLPGEGDGDWTNGAWAVGPGPVVCIE